VLTVSATALVLVNHYVWFKHFSNHQQRAYQRMKSYYDTPDDVPSFTEIASYFGLCVWLVPFALFVSLSASDNVLPTMGSEDPTTGDGSKSIRGQSMIKAVVDNVLSAISEVGAMAGLKRSDDRL
jgi:transmembrane adaptor Erv26